MRFREFLRTNPFTAIFVSLAVVLCGLTFVFSKTIAIIEFAVVLVVVVIAVVWFSNTVERKKEYMRGIESALAESGVSLDRLSAFPFPAVLAERDGAIAWFNAAFSGLTEDFPEAICADIKEYIGDK